MTISKEQLLKINNLELSGRIDKMSDNQLDEYCKSLDAFIESFPAQETELKNSFAAQDDNSFSKILSTVWEALIKIHANDLAQNCRELSREIRTAKRETIELDLSNILAALLRLSIDIQMAQYKNATLGENGSDKENEEESKQKSILAVDDVSFILSGLKEALQNTKYKFTGVTSGEAALRFIEKHQPDLFILDIEMPEMNGYELAKKIKEKRQTAPIIFLTGNATTEYVIKATQVGASDFIVKPINKKEVLDKIKKHIG